MHLTLTAVGLRILRCIVAATTATATLHIATTDHDDFHHHLRTPPLAHSLQCFPPSRHTASIATAYTINALLERAIFLVLPLFLPIFGSSENTHLRSFTLPLYPHLQAPLPLPETMRTTSGCQQMEESMPGIPYVC